MRAIDAGVLICGECHELGRQEKSVKHQQCTRCGATLHERKPDSLRRSWALLLTAALMYIPANVLPIMTVYSLGKGQPDTIMTGVIELINYDMVPIALVVFVASILVPSFKLVGLTWLLISVQRKQQLSSAQRAVMYRFIEWIGRWSMLDVFVITILVALVKFGNLAAIEAGFGAVAFCSVVVLTMLAAVAFDPRLIWDNTDTDVDVSTD